MYEILNTNVRILQILRLDDGMKSDCSIDQSRTTLLVTLAYIRPVQIRNASLC